MAKSSSYTPKYFRKEKALKIYTDDTPPSVPAKASSDNAASVQLPPPPSYAESLSYASTCPTEVDDVSQPEID